MDHRTDRVTRFEALADEVFEPLQRYLRRRMPREDAQDAFSEVMATLWRRLDDVPPGRELAWSYGVARMTMANQRRAARRHLRLVQRLSAEPGSWVVPGPEGDRPDHELTSALATLPPADQEILRLWAWEHLEAREIAVVLGLGVNAATLRLSRARKKLSDAMRRQSGARPGHEVAEHTEEQSDA